MHTYPHRWTDDTEVPDLESYRFTDALDVVALAELDRTQGWKTWPEVWHLDDEGRLRCAFRASSGQTLQRWADDPRPLRRSRAEGLADGGCPDRWLIVDSRPCGLSFRAGVDESDPAAFLAIRRDLATIGLTLVDAVVFDDQGHWWSMHELTSGTTRWPEPGAAGTSDITAIA